MVFSMFPPLLRTFKVDFSELLLTTIPSQRADGFPPLDPGSFFDGGGGGGGGGSWPERATVRGTTTAAFLYSFHGVFNAVAEATKKKIVDATARTLIRINIH